MMLLGVSTGESPANQDYARYAIHPVKENVKPGFLALKVEKCYTRGVTGIPHRVPAILLQLGLVIMVSGCRDMLTVQKE